MGCKTAASHFNTMSLIQKFQRKSLPVHPLSNLPDGFTVYQLADTGVSVMENFCTQQEANMLIRKAADKLRPSGITIEGSASITDYRVSDTASVFDFETKDTELLPFLERGAMLLGLPYANVESVNVTRYREGGYYRGHDDAYPGVYGDRLYTILVFLNTVPEENGGGTMFSKLRIAAQPKACRAISWINRDADGSNHDESNHAALPVIGDAEKWVIQLWYRSYAVCGEASSQIEIPITTGSPVTPETTLPDGVSYHSPANSP